jgi:hypothetical protein
MRYTPGTMSRLSRLFTVLAFLTASTGCVPVLVGAAVGRENRRNESRKRFDVDFRMMNLSREAQGLKPLDWCSELYGFSRVWALRDPECKPRVKAFEKWHVAALDPPVLYPPKDKDKP